VGFNPHQPDLEDTEHPMQQLVEFATNHWILLLALLGISGLLVHNLLAGGGKYVVDPRRAVELINQQDALVVDVRPVADFAQGHIINAMNLPMNGFSKQIEQLKKYQDRPIIVACRSGAQSTQACRNLRQEGFQEIYNLDGGILAWQNANLPTTRKR
jgi:rhodanese-related sulfurtransferase